MEKPTLEQLEAQLEEIERHEESSELEWQFQNALMEYRGEDQVISFQKYRDENKNTKLVGFNSGLGALDELTSGFHKGDLITITGETGQGKTSFSQFLTSQFSKDKIKSLWFSYEMPVLNFLAKFGEDLPDGYLPKVLSDRNITWIERKIVEGIVKFKIQVVFIDHLHYLFNLRETKNVSLEIGDIMRSLKIIAKKYNITIFIMAHTGKSRDDGSVGLDNIRDSSFVAQESDYVIAVWRDKVKQNRETLQADGIKYTGDTTIFVAKNRYTGLVSSIKTKYVHATNTYSVNQSVMMPTKKEVEEIVVNDLSL